MGQTESIFDDLDGWIKRKQYGFEVEGVARDKFQVVDMQGHEAMSRPYSFVINLVSNDLRVDFDSVIGKPASLIIKQRRGGQQEYAYYGIVTAFAQERKVNRYACYRATIEPRLTKLSRYRYSDYYINKSVPEIIESVLTSCGQIKDVDFLMRLYGNYPQLDFVCQYEESCLDFISRLMEREGIYYYFENGEGRERMVIVDSQFGITKSSTSLTFRVESEPEPSVDTMLSFSCRQHALPQTVKLRNYYYDNTQPQVYGEAQVKQTGVGGVEIYGEDLRTSGQANGLAKIRAEEFLCRERIYEGESSAYGIRPGLFFDLKKHYREDFCQQYMPITVEHEGAQNIVGLTQTSDAPQVHEGRPFYQCRLAAIPSTVQFRPERLTPRPQVVGTMSGFIDGPSGERQYADLDDKGRYKIWFPFRRREPNDTDLQHQSGYVRFPAPNAGPESGMHFPLRKDSEVVLSFAGGNPDLPIIISAVANNKYPNMVTSNNYTRNVLKTRGKNLLEMVDTDQQQMIRIMTPVKNTVISLGNDTRVLDNLAGQRTQTNQQSQSSNGASPARGSTPAANTDGPAAENLQLYTEGNILEKAGGYTRVEAGSVSTADQSETKSPVPGDLMTAVSNDSVSWIGRNENHRVKGYFFNQVGETPPSIASPAPGTYSIAAAGTYNLAATGGINLETPAKYHMKCAHKKEEIGDSHWMDIGTSTNITHGVRTDIFLGQAFTSNIGPLERVFVGARASLFLALKADAHLLKSELNLMEEKKNLVKDSKGVFHGIAYAVQSIKAAVKESMEVTEVDNSVTSIDSGALGIYNEALLMYN